MPDSTVDLIIFGDQTLDVQPYMKDLAQHRGHPVLEDFYAKTYSALRGEIDQLPQHTRIRFPKLTCIEDILYSSGHGKTCHAFQMASTCLYQLGMIISHGINHFDKHSTYALGVCTGALAAAAVSCAQDLVQLVPLAVLAVRVSFRIGLFVSDVAHRFNSCETADESWLLLVPGLDSAHQALSSFLDQTSLPPLRRPYISAVTANAAMISGPPTSLALLLASNSFQGLKAGSCPIYGPYHAPHLYSEDGIQGILTGLEYEKYEALTTRFPILSSNGTTLYNSNFGNALQDAVRQILLKPIDWNAIVDQLKKALQDAECTKIKFTAIGTKSDQYIQKALEHDSRYECLLPPSTRSRSQDLKEPVTDNSAGKSKLAIVGMSGRFPGAKDVEAFWDLLKQGLDVHRVVPPLRWDTKTHVDTTGKGKNTSATPFGCWLDEPDLFDAQFFNISPREAPQVDPAQRLALMTTYEAIEQAGIVPDATPSTRRDRVGVFYGTTSNDWMETNSAQDIGTYFIPGGNRAFIPGRINYFFKFSGPSYAVDTACSSSLASFHLACSALWKGEVDTAISGGTNVLTNPDFTAGLDRGHFLSRTGNCKTFDETADGYCRGEGAATVIIKRLEDAILDKDPILGLVLSTSTNHSAEAQSITRPHTGAQREILNHILKRGATESGQVGYIEMHGTGTQVGDTSEMDSVLATFAPAPKASRIRAEPLFLGSAKANIGHGEAASGVSSLIKVLLMMREQTIVPHCGIKTKMNRKFPTDLTQRNIHIALEPKPWQTSGLRKAVVNNFSAAGGNSAVLLEEAPNKDVENDCADPRTQHVVAISARSSASMKSNIRAMLSYLKNNPAAHLGKLSYTTTARRLHHPFRLMVSGNSVQQISTQIEAALGQDITRAKTQSQMIFTYTGQGAHYPGMGKELFENFSIIRSEMERLDQLGQNMGLPSAMQVVQSDHLQLAELGTRIVQLAGVYLQMALTKFWASLNIRPSAVVGHSLGEYAALNAAGVLSDLDTIWLVGKRAALIEENCRPGTHSMLVVNASAQDIAPILKDHHYEIACLNSPVETVLTGMIEDLQDLRETLTLRGLKSTPLKVPYAFHSAQMDPILEELEQLADNLTISEPKIPVLSALDGEVHENKDSFNSQYFVRHTRETVNMQHAIRTASQTGLISDRTISLEIGSHPAISYMIKAVLGSNVTCLPSMSRGRSNSHTLAETLKSLYMKGLDICWPRYHHDFQASHEVIELPSYKWDLKSYWMQYVNDWSLRKGDPPSTAHTQDTLESTTVHKILQEDNEASHTQVIIESDIARKDLSPLVQGHEVDGIPLCTPSVYGDIALTLGRYLLQKYRPDDKEKQVDVSDMTISKALILRADAKRQPLRAQAVAKWDLETVDIIFQSFDSRDRLQEHARCTVRYHAKGLQSRLQDSMSQTKAKLQALRNGISAGQTARFNRAMVYRAIRPLARFHDDYRAIQEIVLNSATLEASSRLDFSGIKKSGTYHTHPAIIDSLTQSCGFAMNCNDSCDLDKEVFMNHGWGSFQIFEPLDLNKSYETYTRMKEGKDKLWRGDVVILDGDKVVAFFGQIAIQGVPRRVLKTILSIESGSRNQKQQAPHPGKAAPTPHAIKTDVAVTSRPPIKNESKFSKALKIIADESGVAEDELTDTTNFADVGIDSLMALSLSARLEDELGLGLDFTALLTDHPTVGHLKSLVEQESGQNSDAESNIFSRPASGEVTPLSPISSDGEQSDDGDTKLQRIVEIVSEESGVAIGELTDDTNLTDAGIDSLLSLVIVSRLRDELELDVQHDSLLTKCDTLADLKTQLVGEPSVIASSSTPPPNDQSKATGNPSPTLKNHPEARKDSAMPSQEGLDAASLATRKHAVDQYVEKYTTGFGKLNSKALPSLDSTSADAKVVLITGGTGSLGSHLVEQLAQRSDVRQVICLNRVKKSTDPYAHQQKAMRDKGVKTFDKIRPKLLVLQTDSAQPRLGLSSAQYDELLSSVTHLVHNAWPMSAKRALDGFESQFQVLRNLIDFASAVSSRRPKNFKFGFQMVSSIGVVGHYGLSDGTNLDKTTVPEGRVGIESVLSNGYSEAKWTCERMLDETLHTHYADGVRTMVVRLGQIAGSKRCGYWNPTEHFGFLVKSSQTIKALPNVPGTLYWTPVEDVAGSLIDLVLGDQAPHPVYHIDNPVGQPWSDMNRVLADALNIRDLVPFEEWIERVRSAPHKDNPASTLAQFFESNYLRMSCGGLVLDVEKTLQHSETLSNTGRVSDEVVRRYIHVWKEIGFLAR